MQNLERAHPSDIAPGVERSLGTYTVRPCALRTKHGSNARVRLLVVRLAGQVAAVRTKSTMRRSDQTSTSDGKTVRVAEQTLSPAVDRHRDIALGLLCLSGPIIATNISRTLMSLVDFIMVSQLGRDAQAAIMPAGLVLWTLIGFGMGLVSIVNTFVAQALGSSSHKNCGAYAWQGLYLSLAQSALVLPMWFLVDPLFAWADHGQTIRPMEAAYTKIGLLGIGPTVAAAALSHFFTGVHRPMVGFVTALISNVFNVVANYALIFGHWGFPAMGIAGAAWATVAASVLHAVLLVAWLLGPHYRKQFHSAYTWRLSWQHMKDLIRVGLPPGVQNSVDIGAWAVFTIFLVGRFGEVHLAANNICFKILEFSFMPAIGMGHALTAAVGKAIGQGRIDRARRYVYWCAVFCIGYMGLVGLMMAVFRHGLPGLLTNDAEVIRWAGYLMVMGAIFQIFDALNITFGGALRGAGDTLWPAIAWGISQLVILLGGGWLIARMVPEAASAGVWGVATFHVTLLGCILGLRYRYGPWAQLNLFREV